MATVITSRIKLEGGGGGERGSTLWHRHKDSKPLWGRLATLPVLENKGPNSPSRTSASTYTTKSVYLHINRKMWPLPKHPELWIHTSETNCGSTNPTQYVYLQNRKKRYIYASEILVMKCGESGGRPDIHKWAEMCGSTNPRQSVDLQIRHNMTICITHLNCGSSFSTKCSHP
jgi:hypothetical protein